jgi:hypothetical protein
VSRQSPEQLRRKAREILGAAEHALDLETRATLTRMAASYVQMARQLEDLVLPGTGRWDMQQPAQQAQGRDKG